jgi:hypothetical protein
LDLVATAPGVIACNMADTPLGSGSVDAAVFSLALMGLDFGAFLVEAARVLKQNGWLWIAEVSCSGMELSAEGSPGGATLSLEAARAAGCGLRRLAMPRFRCNGVYTAWE